MRACTPLLARQTLEVTVALSLCACYRATPEPTPRSIPYEHAGTYRVTVERGHYSRSAPNPLQGVLVLQPGRLPPAVLDRLPGTYFTARDARAGAGEACLRWEQSAFSPRTGYPRRRPYATAWRSSGDTLELVLSQSLYDRYIWSLVVQPDGRLIGVGKATSVQVRVGYDPLPFGFYPSLRSGGITAERIGDARPTECLPDPETRAAAAEPFTEADGAARRRSQD